MTSTSITELLQLSRDGDEQATSRLMDAVYDELKMLARGLCRSAPAGDQTLSATALVNEAFMRLASANQQPSFEARRQFYAFASKVMRNVLVDHARQRDAEKRGGGVEVLPLDEALAVIAHEHFDWLDFDDALNALGSRDERLARQVELRFFGGLNTEEAAAELNVSPRTARREWQLAKAFMNRELTRGQS